jgi:hypothetical protein
MGLEFPKQVHFLTPHSRKIRRNAVGARKSVYDRALANALAESGCAFELATALRFRRSGGYSHAFAFANRCCGLSSDSSRCIGTTDFQRVQHRRGGSCARANDLVW